MKGDPTIAALEHMREARFEHQRTELEKRLIHFAAGIREAEAQGDEGRAVLKELKILRAFFIRDAEALGFEIRLHEDSKRFSALAARVEVFFRGKPPGALGIKMKYAVALVKKHPGKSWKALHTIALREADCTDSPFGREGDDLYDKRRECGYERRDFEKLISIARNHKLPKTNPKMR